MRSLFLQRLSADRGWRLRWALTISRQVST